MWNLERPAAHLYANSTRYQFWLSNRCLFGKTLSFQKRLSHWIKKIFNKIQRVPLPCPKYVFSFMSLWLLLPNKSNQSNLQFVLLISGERSCLFDRLTHLENVRSYFFLKDSIQNMMNGYWWANGWWPKGASSLQLKVSSQKNGPGKKMSRSWSKIGEANATFHWYHLIHSSRRSSVPSIISTK